MEISEQPTSNIKNSYYRYNFIIINTRSSISHDISRQQLTKHIIIGSYIIYYFLL